MQDSVRGGDVLLVLNRHPSDRDRVGWAMFYFLGWRRLDQGMHASGHWLVPYASQPWSLDSTFLRVFAVARAQSAKSKMSLITSERA